MRKRLLQIILTYAVVACILPAPANASSWEDQLNEAWQIGFEEGYSVGWGDAECAMEYGDNGYSSNNSYTPDELDEAYDDGYGKGYADGREDGFDEGYDDGMSNAEPSWYELLIFVGIPCVIAFYFGKSTANDALKNEVQKYKIENIKLQASLKPQNNAVYILDMISKKHGVSIDFMAESLFINFRKAGGCTEEVARAELQKEKQNWPQS